MNMQGNLSRFTVKALIVATIVTLAMICCLIESDAAIDANFKQSTTGNTETSVIVKWDPVPGAVSYKVTCDAEIYKTTKNKVTIKNLVKNKEAWVSLASINSKNSEMNIDTICVKPIPTKMRGLKLESFSTEKNSAYFSWNYKYYPEGYRLKVYTRDGKTKVVDQRENEKCRGMDVVKKLKANRFYKAKVRPYVVIDGKRVYGPYSSYRYVAEGPMKISYKKYTNKLAIKWDKVSGATTYTVYVSDTTPGEMVKVKTTKSNKMYLTRLKGKKFSKKKEYWIRVVANKKVGKTYHKSTPSDYKMVRK